MKSQISDLESENGFICHKVDEKDANIEPLLVEILQLKSKNSDNLVKDKFEKSSFHLKEM
jgi:hypothetical protein